MSIPAVDPLTSSIPAPERDDDEFDRPWNPWALVLFTLVFGLIGGGGLLAFNFKYLGMRGRMGWALAGVLLASVVIACGIHWASASSLIDARDRGAHRALLVAGHVVSMILAAAIAATQHGRWQQFRSTGSPRGKLLVPGLFAALISGVIQIALSNAAWLAFNLLYGNGNITIAR